MADQTNAEVSDERLRELLPCSFCGAENRVHVGFIGNTEFYLTCGNCGAHGPLMLQMTGSTIDLERGWNRRSVTSQASEGEGKVEWTYMPSYGAMDWQQLTEAVSEARVGDRHHPLPGLTNPTSHIGHTMVPEINFNSLNRIVTAFVNVAPVSKRVERLETALNLALAMLIKFEPPDSRAVSDEFVAMAAISAGGDTETPECIDRQSRAPSPPGRPLMTTLDKTAREAAYTAWDAFDGTSTRYQIDDAIRAYIDALSSLPAQAVGVKALEWSETGFAHTGIGLYFYLYPDHGAFHLERHEGSATTHSVWPSAEQAKAFAQDKWHELVNSVIAPSQPAAVGELLTRAATAARIMMEYDAWEVPAPAPADPIDYAWTAQVINDLAAALVHRDQVKL